MKTTALLCSAALFLGACQNLSTSTDNAGNGNVGVAEASAHKAIERPGFATFEKDGRLTVFRLEDPALVEFQTARDLVKSVTHIGVGPNGCTVRAPDDETIAGYVLARPGFVTRVVDGRIWVFTAGSEDFAEFCKNGEPAKCVTRIGAGPEGQTVRSSDQAVIDAWLAAL